MKKSWKVSVLLGIVMMKGVLRHVSLHGVNVDQQSRVIGLARMSVSEYLQLSRDAYEPCRCRVCCK